MKLVLLEGPKKDKRRPKQGVSLSEIMTILLLFHVRFRDFKTYYTGYVIKYWRGDFPDMPSYSRFVTLMKQAVLPMTLFTHLHSGQRTGIYYIDSTCLPVCHIKRSRRHKTFDGIGAYGKTSVAWFFGLKLHIVINNIGKLIAFRITSGHKNDGK
jgi:Transposase DDE domain